MQMMLIRNGQTDNGLIISSSPENLLPAVVAASKIFDEDVANKLFGKLQMCLRMPTFVQKKVASNSEILAGKAAGADDDKIFSNVCEKKP